MKKTALSIFALQLAGLSYALPPIMGPASICMFSSTPYTDATPGGTW